MLRTEKQIPAIYLFLTVTVIVAFRQVYQCNFINLDDPEYVTGNIHVRHGVTMEAIRWAFTSFDAANWHPLTWMSHMLDVQLYGLNPHWHHLTNLLFHIANVLLLTQSVLNDPITACTRRRCSRTASAGPGIQGPADGINGNAILKAVRRPRLKGRRMIETVVDRQLVF